MGLATPIKTPFPSGHADPPGMFAERGEAPGALPRPTDRRGSRYLLEERGHRFSFRGRDALHSLWRLHADYLRGREKSPVLMTEGTKPTLCPQPGPGHPHRSSLPLLTQGRSACPWPGVRALRGESPPRQDAAFFWPQLRPQTQN